MTPGSVFWHIGANVGVLTLYAATRGDLEVWTFELAAVNYYNLVANSELNHVESRVRCLQFGFGHTHRDRELACLTIDAGAFVHLQGKQKT
jgi:tRNA1(Val) A37 N6-methylase TrmN6